MKRIIIAALTIAAMVGCTKEEGFESYSGSDNIVNFSSQSIGTRTNDAGTEWEEDDKIGIYSVGFASDYANVAYEADQSSTTTTFSLVEGQTQILYPNAESGSVDFYAYYPYDANVGVSDIATIDISEQSDLGTIDFMTASESVDYGSQVVFDFSHNLSQVIFNISLNKDGSLTSLEGLTARLEGIETRGDYYTYGPSQGSLSGSISEVEDVDLAVAVADGGQSATITSILHPANYTGATLENSDLVSASTPTLIFELNGKPYIVSFAAALTVGDSHVFSVTLGFDGVTMGSADIYPWQDGEGSSLDYLDACEYDIVYNAKTEIYQIYTGVGLKAFADLVNGNSNSSGAATYGDSFASFSSNSNTAISGRLMDNIDLSTVCYEVDGSTTSDISWTPIGSGSSYKYSGEFDGNGFRIQNLYINSTSSYQGLFGWVNGATISDLGIASCSITSTGTSYIGGVVGYASYSAISGCYNMGAASSVSGSNSNVGGIAGRIYSTTVVDCYNTGVLTATGSYIFVYIGGIVGRAEESSSISDCYSNGTISGSSDGGGIAGRADASFIRDCYNTGSVEGVDFVGGVVGHAFTSEVSGCYNTGSVEGTLYNTGGVVGLAETTSTTFSTTTFNTVIGCYNTGSVKGKYDTGGVVGEALYYIISDCYNTGNVEASLTNTGGVVGNICNYTEVIGCYNTGDVSSSHSNAGGVVGYGTYYTSSIKDCYNTGNVSSSGSSVGGILGYGESIIVSGCYNTGDVEGGADTVGGVAGYTTSYVTSCYNTGDVTGGGNNIGGVVGYTIASSEISSCYNTGAISSGGNQVGGVVGRNYSGNFTTSYATITYCYYDTTVVGTIGALNGGDSDANNVKGLTTAEMIDDILLTGLNEGVEVWNASSSTTLSYWFSDTDGINNYYPILSWQVE